MKDMPVSSCEESGSPSVPTLLMANSAFCSLQEKSSTEVDSHIAIEERRHIGERTPKEDMKETNLTVMNCQERISEDALGDSANNDMEASFSNLNDNMNKTTDTPTEAEDSSHIRDDLRDCTNHEMEAHFMPINDYLNKNADTAPETFIMEDSSHVEDTRIESDDPSTENNNMEESFTNLTNYLNRKRNAAAMADSPNSSRSEAGASSETEEELSEKNEDLKEENCGSSFTDVLIESDAPMIESNNMEESFSKLINDLNKKRHAVVTAYSLEHFSIEQGNVARAKKKLDGKKREDKAEKKHVRTILKPKKRNLSNKNIKVKSIDDDSEMRKRKRRQSLNALDVKSSPGKSRVEERKMQQNIRKKNSKVHQTKRPVSSAVHRNIQKKNFPKTDSLRSNTSQGNTRRAKGYKNMKGNTGKDAQDEKKRPKRMISRDVENSDEIKSSIQDSSTNSTSRNKNSIQAVRKVTSVRESLSPEKADAKSPSNLQHKCTKCRKLFLHKSSLIRHHQKQCQAAVDSGEYDIELQSIQKNCEDSNSTTQNSSTNTASGKKQMRSVRKVTFVAESSSPKKSDTLTKKRSQRSTRGAMTDSNIKENSPKSSQEEIKRSQRTMKKMKKENDDSNSTDAAAIATSSRKETVREVRKVTSKVVKSASEKGADPLNKCTKCDKKFLDKRSLVRHMQKLCGVTLGKKQKQGGTALEEKNLNYSGKRHFILKSPKLSHSGQVKEVTSLGQPRFSCGKCEATFTRRSSVKRHSIIHSEPRS